MGVGGGMTTLSGSMGVLVVNFRRRVWRLLVVFKVVLVEIGHLC